MSQHKTCTRIAVSIQNMYTYRCLNTKHVRLPLRTANITAYVQDRLLVFRHVSLWKPQIRSCHFSNSTWSDDSTEPVLRIRPKNEIISYYTLCKCLSPHLNAFKRILTAHVFFFNMAPQPPVGQGLLVIEDSPSHSFRCSKSVGPLWTNDQLDAQTSTWHNTTLTTYIHAPGGIRTHNRSRLAS